MTKELMPWAQAEARAFSFRYEGRGCTCFISPPCSYCTHPGNPLNLEECDEAWGTLPEVMAAEAIEALESFINKLARAHLREMRESWSSYGAAQTAGGAA